VQTIREFLKRFPQIEPDFPEPARIGLDKLPTKKWVRGCACIIRFVHQQATLLARLQQENEQNEIDCGQCREANEVPSVECTPFHGLIRVDFSRAAGMADVVRRALSLIRCSNEFVRGEWERQTQ
jgi:hypothetical protein